MGREAVLDTSAVITIFSANSLFWEFDLPSIRFYSPDCVKLELNDFATHKDFLGERAREALSVLSFEKVSGRDIENKKSILGVSGKGGITDCDVASLELSLKKGLPLYIDDFDAHLHFSRFFQDVPIYYGILFVCKILQEGVDKREITNLIFDHLIPFRWENISQKSLMNIRYAVTEFLDI